MKSGVVILILVCFGSTYAFDYDAEPITIKTRDVAESMRNISYDKHRRKDSEQSSLVFVFDTTGSMHDDLVQLVKGAELILKEMITIEVSPIKNFILVPYADPHVGNITKTEDPVEFIGALNSIHTGGGGDCPEKSLSAIEKAVDVSFPRSYIYVFTDASSNDVHLVEPIINSIQRKKSQIVFVLTGNCNDTDQRSYQVYEDIVMASSGQIFNLKENEITQLLEYVRDTIDRDRVNIASFINPPGYDNVHDVSVDDTVRKLSISVSGPDPQVGFQSPSGDNFDGPPKVVLKLDLPEIKIVEIINPEPGEWKVIVGSTKQHSVKLSAISSLKFDYGFFLSDTDNLHETTNRPLQNSENGLLIDVKEGMEAIDTFNSIEIINGIGEILYEIPLKRIDGQNRLFKTEPFIPPDHMFYFAIKGFDVDKNQVRRLSDSAIQAQWKEKPYVGTVEKIIAPLGSTVTLRCNVESLESVSGRWFRNKRPLQNKFTFKQSGIIEFELNNVTENDEGMYRCSALNSLGPTSVQTNVIVTGPLPEVHLNPINAIISSDDPFTLECLIESDLTIYTVSMYHIVNSEKRKLQPLTSKRVGSSLSYTFTMIATKDKDGMYSCEATNKMGKSTAETIITIEHKPMTISLKRRFTEYRIGENITNICTTQRAKYAKWLKLDEDEWQSEIIQTTQTEDNTIISTLNVMNMSKSDAGSYVCIGYKHNIGDLDAINATFVVEYVEEPYIKNDRPEILVHVGEHLIIDCEWTGVPAPFAIWIAPDGTEINSNEPDYKNYIFINERQLYVHSVNVENQGQYTCKVENQYGQTETAYNVIVWKKMEFINRFEDRAINVHESVNIVCDVIGIPPPNIQWFFNDNIIPEPSIKGNNTVLHINDFNIDDEGRYKCIAENQHEKISNEALFTITGSKPIVTLLPQNDTFRPNITIFIECAVESEFPIQSAKIYFHERKGGSYEKRLLPNSLTENESKTIYSHRLITSDDMAGFYSCAASNLIGESEKTIFLSVLPFMEISVHSKIVEFQIGEQLSIQCNVNHADEIEWEIPNQFDSDDYVEYEEELFNDTISSQTVYIANPNKSSEGIYVCNGYRGLDKEERVKEEVEVKYVEKPTVTANESHSVEVGQTVELKCNSSGIPLPTISWISPNDSVIVSTDQSQINDANWLILKNITVENEGVYTCRAENRFGRAENTSSVQVWKKPYFPEQLKNQSVDIYGSISVNCNINGIPKPNVAWYRNEVIVANNTLNLTNVEENDEGKYSCLGENEYGSIVGEILLEITGKEKPVLDKRKETFIAREGESVEVVCSILAGKPTPTVQWMKDGKVLVKSNKIKFEDVTSDDDGNYTCFATNSAGEDTYEVSLNIYTKPKFVAIRSDVQQEEPTEVIAGDSVRFKCESLGKPRPLITWSKDGEPVIYSNFIFTNDNDSIVISKTEETDAGVYTCHAHNPVGTSYKNFTLVVLVKPMIMNDTFNPVLQTIEGQMVVLPCPVYAVPSPEISWFLDNTTIDSSSKMQIDTDNTLRFVANLTDTGVYQCRAVNKAGDSTQDYLVLVFMPPTIYPKDNEVIQLSQGSATTLTCNTIGFPDPEIHWDKDGKSLQPIDVPGKLYLSNVTRNDSGTYTCIAANNAGLTQKLYFIVLNEPPLIYGTDSTIIEVLSGKDELNIPCQATGKPQPSITWLRDGSVVTNDFHTEIKADGSLSLKFLVEKLSGIYTCQATNSEGSIKVDYDVRIITPPAMEGDQRKTLTIVEGSNITLECPIKPTLVLPKIEWYKDFQLIVGKENETKLVLDNVNRNNSKYYSCIASNSKGKALADFNLVVHWAPSLVDDNNTDVHLLEGHSVRLECIVDSNPEAEVRWMKDSTIFDDSSTYFDKQNVKVHHAGEHTCIASNRLGFVKKTFKIHVSTIPIIEGDEFNVVEVRAMREVSLECLATGIPKPTITWNLTNSNDWTVNGNGDVLHTPNISRESTGMYICDAVNAVGSARKHFEVVVLEPPKIKSIIMINDEDKLSKDSGEYYVEEGATVKISCVSDGNPAPNIRWIKNGIFFNETLKNEGNLVLVNATKKHSGRYTCIASNKVGMDERDINVEVLLPPHFLHDLKVNEDGVKVIKLSENYQLTLDCLAKGNPSPDVYWFKDKKHLKFYDNTMLTKEHGFVLSIRKTLREHSGKYMCVVRNKVAERTRNFHIDILTPPEIDKDDINSELKVYKGEGIKLECPTIGNPKPVARWIKEPFFEFTNGSWFEIIPGKVFNSLIIANASINDSGKYTCIVTNEVGSAETSYVVEVLEMPKISVTLDKTQNIDKNGTIVVKIRRGTQLICNATGYPEPTITWYKDDKPINDTDEDSVFISTDGSYLNLLDTLVTDSGKYTCVAKNTVGKSKHDFKIKVIVPGDWTPWSQWSSCSAPCGLGKTKRHRSCGFNGNSRMMQTYNLDEDHAENMKKLFNSTDDFLDKSSCTGNDTEVKSCTIRPCKIDGGWGDWSSWSNCSKECGEGVEKRYRICNNPYPRYGGNPCSGISTDERKCKGSECSYWLPWSPWSSCSVTCGDGFMTRRRTCKRFKEDCQGLPFQKAPCSKQCIVDGGWSEWGPWQPCLVTCGEGKRRRTRTCNSPVPKNGGKPCNGGNMQFSRCEGLPSCGRYGKYNRGPGFNQNLPLRNLDTTFKDYYQPHAEYKVDPDASNELLDVRNPEYATGEDLRLMHRTKDLKTGDIEDLEECQRGFQYNPNRGYCDDIDECLELKCHKTQMCENTYGSYRCFCQKGYLSVQSGRCLDINECTQNIHGCSHICVNTPGSYQCHCPDGLLLNQDYKTCTESRLVGSQRGYIIIKDKNQ